MLEDQAQALRSWVKDHALRSPRGGPAARRARLVAISSGKGGVGKSNIAVNLAVRLSEMGRRVVLLDADLGTADADVLCGLTTRGNLAHVVAGRRTLSDIALEAPGGFRLIPGASGLANMAALSEFERGRLVSQLGELEADSDVVLIDTGAGISPNVLAFLLAADEQLIVTTPEPTAVTDAYALIKTAVRQQHDPRSSGGGASGGGGSGGGVSGGDLDIRILVNMARDANDARNVFNRIDAVCKRFLNLSPRFAGHVALDPRVVQAVRRRRPFVLEFPASDASQCISRLAHRLDRHATEPRGEEGLLRRMATWLAG